MPTDTTITPALITTLATEFVTVLIGLYAAFGGQLSDSQKAAVLAVVAPTIAMIALGYAAFETWHKVTVVKATVEAAKRLP